MVLKTFSLQEDVYKKFAFFCRDNGLNMSKQIQMFMQSFIAKEPEVREEYIKKLERIRKQPDIYVGDLSSLKERYI